jgi:hypothetical protein
VNLFRIAIHAGGFDAWIKICRQNTEQVRHIYDAEYVDAEVNSIDFLRFLTWVKA